MKWCQIKVLVSAKYRGIFLKPVAHHWRYTGQNVKHISKIKPVLWGVSAIYSRQCNYKMQTYEWNSLRIAELTAYIFHQRRMKNEREILFNNKIIAFVYEIIGTPSYCTV